MANVVPRSSFRVVPKRIAACGLQSLTFLSDSSKIPSLAVSKSSLYFSSFSITRRSADTLATA